MQVPIWSDLTPLTDGPTPRPRLPPSAVYDPEGHRMLMWSGQGDEGFFNDLWAFNLDQGTWNELSATGTIPNPRYGTVSALDPESGSMAIFAGFTDITYELAAPAPVRLSIVDLLGREVRRLAAGPRLAGRHTAIWDGRDQQGRRAGSGVYLYRLETPAGVQTKKLVLVR